MRRLFVVVLALLFLLPGCYAGDWSDDVYLEQLTLGDQLTLEGDGKVYFELRPDLDFESVRALGAPTRVSRGIVKGFSLPVYSPGEELFLSMHVPDRWDNTSDILLHIHCYLDTANDDKNFNLQISWVHYTDDDVVPNTASENLSVETATGNAPQYQSFHISYVLDYDVSPADPIVSSDELHLRLRRLDASANETAGEVVITHVGLIFLRDKLGSSTP